MTKTRPRELLTKLMMLTTSTNDGEALTALRKANRILAEVGINWEELLSKPPQQRKTERRPRSQPKPKSQPKPQPKPEPADVGNVRHVDAREINELFAVVYQDNISGSFAEFIESVHAFWSQRGYLTERQYAALKQAAARRGWRASQTRRSGSDEVDRDTSNYKRTSQ